MEAVESGAEPGRVAADLVQRDEARVAVVRRVLDALRHDCPGRLLEAHAQLVRGIGQPGVQHLDRACQRGLPPDGDIDCGGQVRRSLGQVGAIHRERYEQLGDRLAGARHRSAEPGEAANFRAQDRRGDQPLARLGMLGERQLIARQRPVQVAQRRLGGRVDEQRGDLGERVVAGRARHRPGCGQLLAGLEDLLDGEPRVGHGCPQARQVAQRVGEAVRVVDPQPGHAVADEAQHLAVRRLEDRRVLDPEPGQGRHGEEAAVALLDVRPAEADQLVVLPVVYVRGAAAAGTGREREAMRAVAQLVADHPQVACRVEVVAQDREQQAPARPVDVEPPRIRRARAEAQHVPPRLVLGRVGDAGVVRHHVEDEPQPTRPRRVDESPPRRRPAARGVDPAEVDDVVAVPRAARCGQDR